MSRIDRTTYAHTSGQAIAALAAGARIFGDEEWLDLADTAAADLDPQGRLDRLKAFFNEDLGAHAERLGDELDPWIEVPTQAALAWWLHYLPAEDVAASHVDPEAVRARLEIRPGADPDDIALGFFALQRSLSKDE